MSSEEKLTEDQEQLLRSLSPLSDPFLVVENTGIEYLTKTLFTIVNSLLPAGSNLKYLKCRE
jgi:hypothetical protein